ncbi:DNA repair protein-like protein rad5 [Dendryphion nanum]|uniref:DNA repair protein-like protein rad5 n=1 Tax=Dendryphion nanum TaxID=256645 RepID=A0A9P9ICQ5_9PLEO|nr:DNA repair protein-like protein rad5 [Dendryphion nanum]
MHEEHLEEIVNCEDTLSARNPRKAFNFGDGERDEGDKQAVAEFKQQERKYEDLKKKNGGTLSFKHDVDWIRIQTAEEVRRKKRKRDQLLAREERQENRDDSLFPDDRATAQGESDFGVSHGGQFGSGIFNNQRKNQKPSLPRKNHSGLSLVDAELKSMNIALEADRDKPRKQRKVNVESDNEQDHDAQPSGSKTGAKAKGPKIKKPKGKGRARGSRMSGKQKAEQQKAIKAVSSLFTGDIFRDQAAQDAPDQPTFKNSTKRKADALKELIASVPSEDMKKAKGDMAQLLAATKDFDGHASVKAHGDNLWLVRGMKTALKNYQVMGTAFMRRRENAAEEPLGGLMADQMGLGKTVMMIANIINGRPPAGHRKTTLIIASPSLISQWASEIRTHVAVNLRIMRYGTGARIDSTIGFEVLAGHDIVLTTYGEVMKSYPKNEPPITCQTAVEKIQWWKTKFQEGRGILHQIQFYRIVLDEAQAIKNHASRTSIACRALMADHRWAISGTPILNSLEELYPYFKFLNVPHTGSFKIFKHNYCDMSDPDNTERLLVRLTQFMIRRTHGDIMFNAPILKLPEAKQQIHWCEFNPIERSIYDIVRVRFSIRINQWSSRGELDRKSYSNALVLLLRLRQLTAHVLMLELVMRDLLELEDIEQIRQAVKNTKNDGRNGRMIGDIRKQLDKLTNEKKKGNNDKSARGTLSDDDGDDHDDAEEETQFAAENEQQLGIQESRLGRSFGREYNFQPYFESLTTGQSWEQTKKNAECCSCHKHPEHAWITCCNHIYCGECYDDMIYSGAANEANQFPPCRACGSTVYSGNQCDANGQVDTDAYPTGPVTRSKRNSKAKRIESPRLEKETISDDWLAIGGGSCILPSAKTIAVKAQILNWFEENHNVKVIIYTQFRTMIKILAKVCQEEGWGFEEYHGGMSCVARDKAIVDFAQNADNRILLASLRSGGLGLNLTMASRVIVMDPWWNSASEQQAFCRVFRIGQKEQTSMTRFCVKDTVDEHLIRMQERKQAEIDTVMEDGGKTSKRMGLKDLMRLFGPITVDSTGKPFILVDNPDSRGGFYADQDHEGYADEA